MESYYFTHFRTPPKVAIPEQPKSISHFLTCLKLYNKKHAPHTSLVQQLSKTVYTCSDWGVGMCPFSILNFCLFCFLHFYLFCRNKEPHAGEKVRKMQPKAKPARLTPLWGVQCYLRIGAITSRFRLRKWKRLAPALRPV